MIITRKIQVYISEPDAQLKKDYIHTVYRWRDLVRKGANLVVTHKFIQQNVRDFVYIKDEIKDKFYIKDIIKEGKGMSEQNTTYRVLSDIMKGNVPADIYSSLNQAVANTYKETASDVIVGKASVRSYKNNIPIPFSKKAIDNIHRNEEDDIYYFTLFGIPFGLAFGRDRSNNRIIVDRCIAKEYKICSSSIQIDDAKKKMFLLLCVDIPKKEVELNPKKKLYAFLGVMNPITYALNDANKPVGTIGTKEEFNYRRRQIQEAVKRCQINNRYSIGGHGRKKKTQAIDRFHDKEKNYVDTKLHTYTRMLVDVAIKNKCGEIVLMNQTHREDEAKEDEFVLRNWSYFGLKSKLEYKCKMVGIKITEEK